MPNSRNGSRYMSTSHRTQGANNRHMMASTSPSGTHGYYHYSNYVAQALKVLKSGHSDGPAEPVVLEGVLMKYKPSVVYQYLERWCQATRTAFHYYVSKAAPKGWQTKPLITVPLECIESVQKVEVNVQSNPQDTPMRQY